MNFKHKNRALFLAMQADAKDFPGGIRAVAEYMGRNGNTLGNQLNPEHEAAPPSMEVLIELIKLTHGRRTVFGIAQLVDQVTFDQPASTTDSAAAVTQFLELLHEASEVFAAGSEFAKDLRFDADERKRLEPLLLHLMQATADTLKAVRG